MSDPILPLEIWPEGITQARIPANDNALRVEVLVKGAIDVANSEPGAPVDGDIHIVGTPWDTFNTDDVVIYSDGTWLGFEPFQGWLKSIGSGAYMFDGSNGWTVFGGGGGGSWGSITGTLDDQTDLVEALDDVDIVTEATAFTAVPATHGGRRKWTLAGGNITFDSAEAMAAGQVYPITATAAISLVEDGVTLTPTAGGSLDLEAGMSVEIRMTSGTAGQIIGQTVSAS